MTRQVRELRWDVPIFVDQVQFVLDLVMQVAAK
jgi:hypothetical protein